MLRPFIFARIFFFAFLLKSVFAGFEFSRFHTVVDFFSFLLLAKMVCNLYVGSAIHNVHNTLKECNTSYIDWTMRD